ncbi:ROK family transcriptional regulator [Bifidobacterium sp. 82T24]|uniref:ROK family transcriptional regulator n=1 Tax=Bifidobacterium pluvialisilvae TaxID=2834436 RepID=UPI001C569C30|nr:ROK family transcriptional regulator [Bifidobacterium pluvialisilvae]MBW3087267.1 ROK family transcriptional regulator [Bifidobacterium pluvialisilvae]
MTKAEENTTLNDGTLELLTRLRARGAMTRSEIGAATGWARPTVNKRIDELVSIGIVRPLTMPSPTGGRPAQGFAFDASCAVILAVDIATTVTTLALCDLSGRPVTIRTIEVGAENGPEETLGLIYTTADGMLADDTNSDGDTDDDGDTDGDDASDTPGADASGAAPHATRLCAVSIAVTTRVETSTGNIIQAPVMRHWENHNLRDLFSRRYQVPAFVENDANVRALCKAYELAGDGERMVGDLLYVHAGMGLGAGIISSGVIMHGSGGAAGDIGHIHVLGEVGADRPCRCGNIGCVEASAGGWAILQSLQDAGKPVHTLADVVGLARQGDIETVQLVRRAGRLIGDAISTCVNLLNPSYIIVGGELSDCGELLMSGIRERVWARAQPLATTSLHIESCDDEARAGIIGLAYAAIDQGLTSLEFLRQFA